MINPGVPVAVTWTVANTGTVPANAAWTDAVYLSHSPTLDGTAVLLGTKPAASTLAAGGSYDATFNASLPANTAAGDYYLLLVTNANARQGEADATNNLRAVPITLGLPNLVISNPSAPAAATLGQTVAVSWTVTNVIVLPRAGIRAGRVHL